jgi:hypothetical protein
VTRPSLHFTQLLGASSPHFNSLHFTSLIITFLTLFLKTCGLRRKVASASAEEVQTLSERSAVSSYMYIFYLFNYLWRCYTLGIGNLRLNICCQLNIQTHILIGLWKAVKTLTVACNPGIVWFWEDVGCVLRVTSSICNGRTHFSRNTLCAALG